MNLDELQTEVEQLLYLLKDRQSGLSSWNILLAEKLRLIKELIEKGGI